MHIPNEPDEQQPVDLPLQNLAIHAFIRFRHRSSFNLPVEPVGNGPNHRYKRGPFPI